MIHAETHLLGSWSGYTTIDQSPGLLATEVSALESPGFGQSDDEAYRSSLATRPAAVGRLLPSGRYAVSRCLVGPPDAAGRSTLVFATLVFSLQDWLGFASERLFGLLRDERPWLTVRLRKSSVVSFRPTDYQPTVFPSDLALATLDAWLCERHDSRNLITLPETDDGAAIVTGLPRLLPARERESYTWGIRVLSSGAPVSIATMATMMDSRRRAIAPTVQRTLSHAYSRAVLSFWRSQGTFPADFVAGCASAEFAGGGLSLPSFGGGAPAERGSFKSKNAWLLAAGGLLGFGVLAGAYWAYAATRPAPAPPPRSTDAHRADSQSSQDELAAAWTMRSQWDRSNLERFYSDVSRLLSRRLSQGSSLPTPELAWLDSPRPGDVVAETAQDELTEMYLRLAVVREWIIASEIALSSLKSPPDPQANDTDESPISQILRRSERLIEFAPTGIATNDIESTRAKLSAAMQSRLPGTAVVLPSKSIEPRFPPIASPPAPPESPAEVQPPPASDPDPHPQPRASHRGGGHVV